MLAVSSSNHRQRSGRNLADGHAIPESGLLLTTWHTPTLGFRKQERMLRTGSTGGCLRSIAQRTRGGACSYWIGVSLLFTARHFQYMQLSILLPGTAAAAASDDDDDDKDDVFDDGGHVLGLVNCVAPMVLSETSPPNYRGAFGTVHQLSVTIGIFLSSVFGLPQLMGELNFQE